MILENAFAIMETLKSMPTEAKELDEFWTGNPDPSMAFLLAHQHLSAEKFGFIGPMVNDGN